MRNGVAEPFEVESLGSGTRVRIGSADVLLDVSTVQEYKIAYRTGRQLWFDENGDELYWNVTGNFWDFRIVESKVRVILPEGIEVLEAEAYTGLAGEKERNYVKAQEKDGVSFRTTTPLSQREGLTIVVRWEPGKLDAVAYKKPGVWDGNFGFRVKPELFTDGTHLTPTGYAVIAGALVPRIEQLIEMGPVKSAV
jgi:hypothetical protein